MKTLHNMKFRTGGHYQGMAVSRLLFNKGYSYPVWGFKYNYFGEFGIVINDKNKGISYINSEKEFNEHPATETTLEELKAM